MEITGVNRQLAYKDVQKAVSNNTGGVADFRVTLQRTGSQQHGLETTCQFRDVPAQLLTGSVFIVVHRITACSVSACFTSQGVRTHHQWPYDSAFSTALKMEVAVAGTTALQGSDNDEVLSPCQNLRPAQGRQTTANSQ